MTKISQIFHPITVKKENRIYFALVNSDRISLLTLKIALKKNKVYLLPNNKGKTGKTFLLHYNKYCVNLVFLMSVMLSINRISHCSDKR